MEKPGVLIPAPFITPMKLPQLERLPKLPTAADLLYQDALPVYTQQRVPAYMSDFNDPNQVNSTADLIVRNVKYLSPLYNSVTGILKAFNIRKPEIEADENRAVADVVEWADRKFTPIIKGTQKFVTGYEKTDPSDLDAGDEYGVALNNTFVDLAETIDIFDNFWKATTIPLFHDKTGLDGVAEGLKNAYNRKNYMHDTGDWRKNLFWEMMTPTNLTGLGAWRSGAMAVKSVAKGMDVPLAKGFVRNALGAGNGSLVTKRIMREAIMKDGNTAAMRAITKETGKTVDEVTIMMRAAQHKNAIAALKLSDKIGGAANAIDLLAMRTSFMSTGIYPTYKLLKWGAGPAVKQMMYAANSMLSHLPKKDVTLLDIVERGPDLMAEAEALYTAGSFYMKEQTPKDVVAEMLRDAATSANAKIVETANQAIGLAPAEMKTLLDETAQSLTGGKITTMNAYNTFLRQLLNVSDSGTGVHELAERVTALTNAQKSAKQYDMIQAIRSAKEELPILEDLRITTSQGRVTNAAKALQEASQHHTRLATQAWDDVDELLVELTKNDTTMDFAFVRQDLLREAHQAAAQMNRRLMENPGVVPPNAQAILDKPFLLEEQFAIEAQTQLKNLVDDANFNLAGARDKLAEASDDYEYNLMNAFKLRQDYVAGTRETVENLIKDLPTLQDSSKAALRKAIHDMDNSPVMTVYANTPWKDIPYPVVKAFQEASDSVYATLSGVEHAMYSMRTVNSKRIRALIDKFVPYKNVGQMQEAVRSTANVSSPTSAIVTEDLVRAIEGLDEANFLDATDITSLRDILMSLNMHLEVDTITNALQTLEREFDIMTVKDVQDNLYSIGIRLDTAADKLDALALHKQTAVAALRTTPDPGIGMMQTAVREKKELIDNALGKMGVEAEVIDDIFKHGYAQWQLSMSSLHRSLHLFDLDPINDLVNAVESMAISKNDTLNYLYTLAHSQDPVMKEYARAAQTFIQSMDAMGKYRRMIADVLEWPEEELSTIAKTRFLDAIQSYYDEGYLLSVTKVQELLKNVRTQVEQVTAVENFKLSNMHLRLKDGGEAYFERFSPDQSHIAGADAYKTMLIYQELMSDSAKYGDVQVALDIEAQSAKGAQARGTQAGIAFTDGRVYQIFAHDTPLSQVPYEADLLRVLLGPKSHNMDHNALRDLYISIFANKDGTQALTNFKGWFEMGDSVTLISVATEKDMMTQVADILKEAAPKTTGNRLQLVMYNGLEYDLEVINKAMRRADVTRVDSSAPYQIKELDVIDPLRFMQEGKVTTLTHSEEGILEKIVENYIERRSAKSLSVRRTQAVGEIATVHEPFVPNFGSDVRDSLDTLYRMINDNTVQSSKKMDPNGSMRAFTGDLAMAEQVVSLKRAVSDHVKTLKATQDDLGLFKYDRWMDNEVLAGKLSEAMGGDALSVKGNIMAFLKNESDKLDHLYPALAVRKTKGSSLLNWYNLKLGDRVPTEQLKRMMSMQRKLEKTAQLVENIERLEEVTDIDTLRALYVNLMNEGSALGGNYFASALHMVKVPTNTVQAFAMAQVAFNQLKNVARSNNMGLRALDYASELVRRLGYDDELLGMLEDPYKLLSNVQDPSLYNKLTSHDSDIQGMIDYLMYNKAELKSIEEQLSMRHDVAPTSKAVTLLRAYEPMVEYFKVIADGEAAYIAARKAGAGENIRYSDRVEAMYKRDYHTDLRMGVEQFDNVLAYNKVVHVLSLEPEVFVDFLYRRANGIIVTDGDSLLSSTYAVGHNQKLQTDPIRSVAGVRAYEAMMRNREAYEALGVEFIERQSKRRTEIIIKLREDVRQLDAPIFNKRYEDVELNLEQAKAMVSFDAGVADVGSAAIDALIRARQNLQTMKIAAHNSTMEKMDHTVFEDLRRILGIKFTDLPGNFEASSFNHSVLGSIGLRRRYMPATPFNPAKTMFNTVSMLHSSVDEQIKYTSLLMDEATSVHTLVKSPEQKQELLEFMQANFRDYKLAALRKDKARGYVIGSIHVDSIKDIETAIAFNAVVMDSNTFDTAYSVINRYRIEPKVLELFQHWWAVPKKVGYMIFSPMTVVRNIIESTAKNVDITQNPEMLIESLGAMSTYYKYTRIVDKVTKKMTEGNYGWDHAVKEVFKEAQSLPREVFDEMKLYKGSDASGGETASLAAFYGDSIDKLYRSYKKNYKDSIPIELFRKYMTAPEDYAIDMIKSHGYGEEIEAQLIYRRKSLLKHKQAYQMHKMYKGQLLTQEDMLRYITNPMEIPPTYKAMIEDMMRKTSHIKLKDDLATTIMHSGAVKIGMSGTVGVEESMRYALFSYLRRNGMSDLSATNLTRATHFDYKNRKQWQLYLELLMPFSTFKLNSLDYWINAMYKRPKTMKAIGNYMRQQMLFPEEDREPQDILRSRSLQYQLSSGNPTLWSRNYKTTTEKGYVKENQDDYALKISAPFMAPFQMLVAPVTELSNMIDSTPRDVIAMVNALRNEMPQYDMESTEEYQKRLLRTKLRWMPMAGVWFDRFFSKETVENPAFNMLVNMAVSKVYIPQDYPDFSNQTYDNLTPRMIEVKDGRKIRAYRAKQGKYKLAAFHSYNRYWSKPSVKFRGTRIYPNQIMRGINTRRSDIWKKFISRSGKSMFRMRALPTNKYTRAMKAKLYRKYITGK